MRKEKRENKRKKRKRERRTKRRKRRKEVIFLFTGLFLKAGKRKDEK